MLNQDSDALLIVHLLLGYLFQVYKYLKECLSKMTYQHHFLLRAHVLFLFQEKNQHHHAELVVVKPLFKFHFQAQRLQVRHDDAVLPHAGAAGRPGGRRRATAAGRGVGPGGGSTYVEAVCSSEGSSGTRWSCEIRVVESR